MTKFEKPGRRIDFCYPDMAKEAGTAALADSGVSYDEVEHACVGYCYGDSTSGQRAVYELGITGIPVYNVSVFFQKFVLKRVKIRAEFRHILTNVF
jgi:hypothetical protein